MYQTVVKPDSNHPSKPAKECEEVKMVSNRNLVDSRDPVRSSYLNEIDSKDKSKSRQKQAKADARYPVGVYSACCSRKAKSNDDPNERKKIHQDDSRKTRKSKLKFHRHILQKCNEHSSHTARAFHFCFMCADTREIRPSYRYQQEQSPVPCHSRYQSVV